MITHKRAINILQAHGLTNGWTLTGWYPDTGVWDETSSFYHEFGVREVYDLTEVKAWLGY